MVSRSTAVFFALIVAFSSQVFASPVPRFDTPAALERREPTALPTIQAYTRRTKIHPAEVAVRSVNGIITPIEARADSIDPDSTFVPTDDGVIVIPAEEATSSDGISVVPFSKRAEGKVNTMPAEVATSSDGNGIKAYRDLSDELVDESEDSTLPTTEDGAEDNTFLATDDGSIVIPAEEATSSDGTNIVPFAKRAEVNTMPAEIATSSDGNGIKAYRELSDELVDDSDNTTLATDDGVIVIPAEEATSSDGTNIVAFARRAEAKINLMPEEMPTSSDGNGIKAYRELTDEPVDDSEDNVLLTTENGSEDNTFLATDDGSIVIPAEEATSSDGTNIVPFAKRAEINTMPAEVATSSDGNGIKAYRELTDEVLDDSTLPTTEDGSEDNTFLATDDGSIVIPAEEATSSDGTNIVPFAKRAEINTMPAEVATSSDGNGIKAYRELADELIDDSEDSTVLPTDDGSEDNTFLATDDGSIVIPAEEATSSDGTSIVPFAKRAEAKVNTMPAEVATSSDGNGIKAY